MESHPYYNIWNSIQSTYTPVEGSNNNINNITTSSKTYKGLVPQNYRYFAWSPGEQFNSLMNDESILHMSKQITKGLAGVHPEGKNIIVPNDTIKSFADSVFLNTTQSVDVMQQMIINYIITTIKSEYEVIENNNKLDIWVTKYDLNSGMQKFNDIKLNNKQRKYGTMWNY